MSTRIRTNRLCVTIDRQRFEDRYDVFCLETSEEYIQRGAKILDAKELCSAVKAIRFESGKSLLILMTRDGGNQEKMRTLLRTVENGEHYSFRQVSSDSLPDYLLVQLLLNGLGTFDSEDLRVSNLTGRFFAIHPNWLLWGRGKSSDVLWQIKSLEFLVTPECCLNLFVRTFTSVLLRDKIEFSEDHSYESYPKYVLGERQTVRRRLYGDDIKCFILRQIKGKKSTIPFLSLQDKESFDCSKMGVVCSVLSKFNACYEGLCSLTFSQEPVVQSIDYSKTGTKEKESRVREVLSRQGIHLVDLVNDASSHKLCETLVDLFREKYSLAVTVGSRVMKARLNFAVIHNAVFYAGEKDPYLKHYDGAAVQHITIEDFAGCCEFALAEIVNEIVIKQDLQDGAFSLFDWASLGWAEDVSFGMEFLIDNIRRYFFITVHPDGSFRFHEQEFTLFTLDTYSAVTALFVTADEGKEAVRGVIQTQSGAAAVIKDTGLFTVPQIEEIYRLLKEGDNKLRGRNRREELLSSCLDIKTYKNGEKAYYFVGMIGEGMKPSVPRAANIRSFECPPGSGMISLDSILPLMNVSFVRNGQLTIVPFPFKYLREYIRSHYTLSLTSEEKK